MDVHAFSYTKKKGGSRNGATPKWMVYNGKAQSKMDDLVVPPMP